MSKKTNLSDLIKVISAQTRQDPELVGAFVSKLFREVEKRLITSSAVKVDGIGLFRVIKTGEGHRILFLANFNNYEKEPFILRDFKDNQSIDVLDREDVVTEALPNNYEEGEQTSDSFIEIDNNSAGNEIKDHQLSSTQQLVNGENIASFDTEGGDHIITQNENKFKAEHQRKINLKIISITTSILILGIAVGYFYSRFEMGAYSDHLQSQVFRPAVQFQELNNPDTLNYSHIVIPENDVRIEEVAERYYGTDKFWPYIYKANESFVSELMDIQAGTIIRVPKIAPYEISDPDWLTHANDLGKEIIESLKSN